MSQISDDVYKIRCKLKQLVTLQVAYKAVMHQPHTVETSTAQWRAHYGAIQISALHDLSLGIRGFPKAHGSSDYAILQERKLVLEVQTPATEVA